jgi:hypothetical protein
MAPAGPVTRSKHEGVARRIEGLEPVSLRHASYRSLSSTRNCARRTACRRRRWAESAAAMRSRSGAGQRDVQRFQRFGELRAYGPQRQLRNGVDRVRAADGLGSRPRHPIARTYPAFTSSAIAPTVSSIGTLGSRRPGQETNPAIERRLGCAASSSNGRQSSAHHTGCCMWQPL